MLVHVGRGLTTRGLARRGCYAATYHVWRDTSKIRVHVRLTFAGVFEGEGIACCSPLGPLPERGGLSGLGRAFPAPTMEPDADTLVALEETRESLEKITAEEYEKNMREIRNIGMVRAPRNAHAPSERG